MPGADRDGAGAWVLLTYRMPREPSTPAVGVWRKLKRLGVAQLADGVVALPADARTREQLEWLAEEVVESGGAATVWGARPGGRHAERELAAAMSEARAAEYRRDRSGAPPRRRGARQNAVAPTARRAAQDRPPRLLPPAERDAGPRAVDELAASGEPEGGEASSPMRWATRADMHIDRAACAWLIRRVVDADAEFVFVADPAEVPADATAFDMRGVELSHHGGDCSFETILRRYEITDPVLWRIAEIVHEADLDDERYDAPEAPGVDASSAPSGWLRRRHPARPHRPAVRRALRVHRRATLLGREPS